jgi:hypothetical protein
MVRAKFLSGHCLSKIQANFYSILKDIYFRACSIEIFLAQHRMLVCASKIVIVSVFLQNFTENPGKIGFLSP